MIITALDARAAPAPVQPSCSRYAALNDAISRFCSKKDIMAPSKYTDDGVQIGTVVVKIFSTCNPPQWIPSDVCVKQFNDICAKGYDDNEGHYGWSAAKAGNCQTWYYGDLSIGSYFAVRKGWGAQWNNYAGYSPNK